MSLVVKDVKLGEEILRLLGEENFRLKDDLEEKEKTVENLKIELAQTNRELKLALRKIKTYARVFGGFPRDVPSDDQLDDLSEDEEYSPQSQSSSPKSESPDDSSIEEIQQPVNDTQPTDAEQADNSQPRRSSKVGPPRRDSAHSSRDREHEHDHVKIELTEQNDDVNATRSSLVTKVGPPKKKRKVEDTSNGMQIE